MAADYTRRHKCQIQQGKRIFLTLVDLFSRKSVKTENIEHLKLDLFYCKISTLFYNYHYY